MDTGAPKRDEVVLEYVYNQDHLKISLYIRATDPFGFFFSNIPIVGKVDHRPIPRPPHLLTLSITFINAIYIYIYILKMMGE